MESEQGAGSGGGREVQVILGGVGEISEEGEVDQKALYKMLKNE